MVRAYKLYRRAVAYPRGAQGARAPPSGLRYTKHATSPRAKLELTNRRGLGP